MGHHIQAIIAPSITADSISARWPELPRLDRGIGFIIFPLDADLIDSRISPDKTPISTGDEFMLLTDGFRIVLRELSRNGVFAYVETEYFGGTGGQGAVVCRDGNEVMPPTWCESGPINRALELIGVPCSQSKDQFMFVGLDEVRDNDDILELIARLGGTA